MIFTATPHYFIQKPIALRFAGHKTVAFVERPQDNGGYFFAQPPFCPTEQSPYRQNRDHAFNALETAFSEPIANGDTVSFERYYGAAEAVEAIRKNFQAGNPFAAVITGGFLENQWLGEFVIDVAKEHGVPVALLSSNPSDYSGQDESLNIKEEASNGYQGLIGWLRNKFNT